ncbi:MAG: hypothetical protein LIO53_08420 [Oscillospiraceae bacterium]|nr:hypothetical protein [Oscillospiraceae bacterium]
MNRGQKKKASQSDKMINFIIAVVILVFLAVGVYATYDKISSGIREEAIANGEAEATVEYLAEQSGMTVDDYLAQYGLSLGDSLKKSSTESEMTGCMTIANYALYSGQETETLLDGFTDAVTEETVLNDLSAMPAVTVLSEEVIAQDKETYGVSDDEVTDETTYEEFQNLLYEKMMEMYQAQATEESAEDTESETETTEETAETETSETETSETDAE